MTEVHEAVGSYVVDALDSTERAEFEAHLDDCTSCTLEVLELQEVVAVMSGLTAQPAPPALRQSVLASIGAESHASDRVVQLHKHGSLAGGDQPVGPAPALSGVEDTRPVVIHEVAPLEEHPSVIPDWSWSVPFDDPRDELAARRNRRIRRVLAAAAAVAVLVALALGGQVYVLSQRNQAQVAATRLQTELETQLLTAPDATTYMSTVNGAPVRYVVSRQRDQALFLGTGLPDPGTTWTYQLWTLKGTAATSAGTVTSTGGIAHQLFVGSLRGSDALAITLEPGPTGSPRPTSAQLSKVFI